MSLFINNSSRPAVDRITRLVQVFLGVTFLLYGVVKLLGGQFVYTTDATSVLATPDGPTLVWRFYGFSPVYGRFIGLCELGIGLLMMIPRTRTVGALLLFPTALNITVMDFCFDFPPVKYFALLLTLLSGFLLFRDRRKLIALLTPDTTDNSVGRPAPRRTAAYTAVAVVSIPIAVLAGNLLLVSVTDDPVDTARTRCLEEGWPRQDLTLVRWQAAGWTGFNREGFVEFDLTGRPSLRLHVAVRRPHGLVGWQVTDYREVPR